MPVCSEWEEAFIFICTFWACLGGAALFIFFLCRLVRD